MNAQIVDIPDANFKASLIGSNCADFNGDGEYTGDVDTNNDGEIQVTEAEAVIGIKITYDDIESIDGIDAFSNLEVVDLRNNELTQLSFNSNQNLRSLNVSSNFNLTNVDVSQNTDLEYFTCGSCYNLLSVDVTQNPSLFWLSIQNSDITSLDLTQNINLEALYLSSNDFLTEFDLSYNINLKSFYDYNFPYNSLNLTNNINLEVLTLLSPASNNNQMNALDLSQNSNLKFIEIQRVPIEYIDVSHMSELEELNIRLTSITTLDVTQNPSLTELFCGDLGLTELDITNCPNIEILNIIGNSISDMDFSNSTELRQLYIGGNLFTTLDLQNTKVKILSTGTSYTNPNLIEVYIKNGVTSTSSWYPPGITVYDVDLGNSPNLQYICSDPGEHSGISPINGEINALCSYTPGGEFYAVEGSNRVDGNNDGCDENDFFFPNLKFNISAVNTSGDYISDASGNYQINLQEGTYTIAPIIENPEYYTVSPTSIVVDLPLDGNPFEQDFCLTATGSYNDLEVIIVPLEEPIPGFDKDYKIVYKNVGNTSVSGSVDLDYSSSSDFVTYLSSSPLENNNVDDIVSWDYSDLAPFEEREILLSLNLNTPTNPDFPLNSGNQLSLQATINSAVSDATPYNNVFTLHQTVVNSFDPNDIRCLEGEFILPERVGEYVHYMIRFENVGTANAINVMVENIVDNTKFDISSLIPLDGSHDFYTRTYGSTVKFIFDDINLPFDDANNDGYVVFKIKTLETLILGDTFSNQARIYFDFNAPIITNTYTTEVSEEQLSITESSVLNTKIHPNPVTNILTIESEAVLNAASIYDINGRIILNSQFEDIRYQMDLSALQDGIYFLKVFSSAGNQTLKVVKNSSISRF